MDNIPTHRFSRTAAILIAAAIVTPLTSHLVCADSLVQTEIARRAASVQQADKELVSGRQLYAEEKYEEAVQKYLKAISLLPSGPIVEERRWEYNNHLVEAKIALSQTYRRVGRYDEAREILTDILTKDPNNKAVKQNLDYLDDPIRTNPSLTYKTTQEVDKVKRHLYKAQGFYDLGKYDDAYAEYEEVLRIDKYNKAARRGMESVDFAKSNYFKSAYDQTRAKLLMEVGSAWETPVVPRVDFSNIDSATTTTNISQSSYTLRKLKNTVIPIVDFQNMPLSEVVDELRQRARELDTLELDPARKGINIIVQTKNTTQSPDIDENLDEFGGSSSPKALVISDLKVRNVTLETVIKLVCDKVGLRYKIEDSIVKLLPLTDYDGSELILRLFSVPPDFLTQIGTGGGSEPEEKDPFAPDLDESPGITASRPVKDLLLDSGIEFPSGATASFSKARAVLTVKNTLNNLDAIEALVDSIKDRKPKQVRMTSKYVEISQENTDELGFDYVLSPFNLSASNSTRLGGGTIGNGAPRTGADFVDVDGGTIGIPVNRELGVENIITGGNRTGDYAITRDSISSFINNPNRSAEISNAAPGILSLTGLFSDGQVQMIMRGLSQKKGTDIMTAPSVIARSGEKATIEIIREFIYPTEYEPPEIPQNVDVNNISENNLVPGAGNPAPIFPVTPATPTAFTTRNTGVTLEVEPTLGEDGFTIDLSFAPEIVEFEGFINYGSPIQSAASDALNRPVTITITDNRIEMPVFSTRRVTTGLTIYDGHTVAVGGLMREDIQDVQDKVPILGDLPYIGRLFQSSAENHIKSNLIIFVSVNIIDATGKSVRSSMDRSADASPGSLLPPPL